jgi:hypothetical protein
MRGSGRHVNIDGLAPFTAEGDGATMGRLTRVVDDPEDDYLGSLV